MQRTIRLLVLLALVIGLGAGPAAAQLVTATKTLSVGTATGNVGDTVSVDISVDDPTGVGGTAFTLLYDPAIFDFVGIEQATKTISDGENCKDSTTGDYTACDAATIGSTLFYQYNEVNGPDGAPLGKVLVAAASAQELTSPTIFKAKFTILGGNGPYPIRLVRTIIDNPAAGYDTPALLEPLVGMPADTPNADGYYPTPTFFTTLQDGEITVTAPGYAITGTVQYDTDGDNSGDSPADGSTVVLSKKIDSIYAFIATTTVQNGAYKFANRPAGDYQISVDPADPAYFKASATITVGTADATQDFVLKKAQRHHGTVTVNGTPLPGVRVEVTDAAGNVVGVFPTDEQGNWETRPLDPNQTYTYKAIYGNQSTQVDENTTSDWALTLYSISGTVSGVDTGATVEITAGSLATKLLLKTTITGNGAYTIDNLLPASDWIVAAATEGKPVQYYNGKQDITQADKVTIADADVANIDFDFSSGESASISGTISKNGTALADTAVYAFDAASFSAVMTTTDQNGAYTLTVPPGSFQIFMTVGGKTYFYSESGATQKPSAATTVTVANGDTKTGIDIVIDECTYAIKGAVTLERTGGVPIAGALVTALGASSRGHAFTDVDGSYTIGGLCAGTYVVEMDPLQGGFPPQDQETTITDSDVTVDFVVDTGFTLSGTVQDENGNAIAGAMLYLVDENTGELVGGRMYFSKSDGSYAIKDIPSGVYTLNANHPDYDAKAESGLAINADTTKNITLSKGAWIYGTVTDANDGTALARVMVVAIPLNDASLEPRFDITDASGAFAIHGLSASANYLVMATKKGYERKIHTPFVTPAPTGTQVDLTLTPITTTFTLSGKVTKECDGSTLADVRVIVTRDLGSNRSFFAATKTDANGQYSFTGLEQASGYTLIFIPPGNLPIAKETGIDGTGGDVTKDKAIECGNDISGTITLGAAADKVYVVLFDASGAYVDHQVLTQKDANGGYPYTFSGLAAGNYKVVAAAAGNTATWYNGKADMATADTVAAGSTGIDIALPNSQ